MTQFKKKNQNCILSLDTRQGWIELTYKKKWRFGFFATPFIESFVAGVFAITISEEIPEWDGEKSRNSCEIYLSRMMLQIIQVARQVN